MKRDKLTDGSKDILPPNVVKGALKQASISDLLNEAFQRRLTVEAQQEPAPGPCDETAPDRRMQRWEALLRKQLQERHRYLKERRGRQETATSMRQSLRSEPARSSTMNMSERYLICCGGNGSRRCGV